MPPSKTADLSSRVDQLVQQRQQHLDAAERISATIAQIESLLGGAGGPRRRGRPPGRPRMTDLGGAPVGAPNGPRRGRRRKRQRFEISGEESIINYIRGHKDATTQDIKKHWATEGRGGTADNALSKLVREKKIKRFPLEGQRGSRFAV
jgi:hypothetical protein